MEGVGRWVIFLRDFVFLSVSFFACLHWVICLRDLLDTGIKEAVYSPQATPSFAQCIYFSPNFLQSFLN
jgi:hypothetical protein